MPLRMTANSRSFLILSGVVILLLVVGFGYYLPLFGQFQERSEAYLYSYKSLLPVALWHTIALLSLSLVLKVRARGCFLFWGFSGAYLVFIGGWYQAKTLILVALFAWILLGLGSLLARMTLPEDSGGWGVSLALGILGISFIGSYLAWAHLLKWWVIALLLIAPVWLEIRRRPAARFANVWNGLISSWNPALALALQGLFLLFVFAYVYSCAPEQQSDALRSYLPYVKSLRRNSGFVDVPYQWAYIIPQAGLTYAGTVITLFRERALQLTSFLVWLALIGIVCRRKSGASAEARTALTLVVASTPVILWVATSLMQDCFVCLAVVVLALLCLEGREPGSARFWAAVGACAGLAWAAKFATITFVLPLVLCASWRSGKARGWVRTALGWMIAGSSALLVLAPWLVYSYRQSGNPVFPFLLKVFPAPNWPQGVGFSNLASFRLPAGPRGWFLWLTDLTYNTSRFVEGCDGKLGMTLLGLVLFGLLAFWKGTWTERAIIASGFVGAAGLISMTAYVRYWMSGLWLVALVVPALLDRVARTIRARVWLSAAAVVVLGSHAFITALGYWPDPAGWPWRYYTGKISGMAYLSGSFRGLEMFPWLEQSWGEWPKVWYTEYDAASYFKVAPMEAVVWELSLHRPDPRSKIQYLASAGCDYWIVNETGTDAMWLRLSGIAQFFWEDRLRVASAGPTSVYRMKSESEVLRDFDERAQPGNDLVADGGFELGQSGIPRFWMTSGPARWFLQSSEAQGGEGYFRISPTGSLRQEIPLPPGIRAIELAVAARGTRADKPGLLRWSIAFKGYEKDPAQIRAGAWLDADKEISVARADVSVEQNWNQYQMDSVAVPRLARVATIFLENVGDGAEIVLDNIHLFSR